MNPSSERLAFEAWFSGNGKWPAAVKRNGDAYLLASAASAWTTWQARAALSTQPQQAGWKLVPDGATKEMLAAACEVDWSNEDADGVVHNIWNAMLAAAPLPPVPGQEGGGA